MSRRQRGQILAPLQGATPVCTVYQGLRSFHSLNPWLFSFHAFGVPTVNSGYAAWVGKGGQILAPFQGAAPVCTVYQGLRSFHSLNPWLFPLHAFGVTSVLPPSHPKWPISSGPA